MYWFVYILLPSIICSCHFQFGFNPLLATLNQKWNLCMCVCVKRASERFAVYIVERGRAWDAHQVNGWWWFMEKSRMRQPLSNAPNTCKNRETLLLLFNCTIRINRSTNNYCRWIKLKLDHRFACASENPTSHVEWMNFCWIEKNHDEHIDRHR